jgi:antitoxin component YwqK of YwqJK toxin-antitoxin module
MIRKVTLFVFIVLLSHFSLFAQNSKSGDSINRVDDNNMKQGHWIITNEEKKYPNFRPNQIVEEGKFTDSKRDGKWIFYYPNDKVKEILTYNNNRPNGYAVFYYANGNIKEEGLWKNNRWVGEYKYYYENGNLKNHWKYNEQGNRTGEQKYFYENGNLMIEGKWENGKEDGVITEFHEDGSVKSERVFENGGINLAKTTNYKPKEKLSEKSVVESKPKIIVNPNTVEDNKQAPFDGNGYYELKNKNGQVIRKGNFENGYLINGQVFQYTPDGTLFKTTHYKEGRIIKVED